MIHEVVTFVFLFFLAGYRARGLECYCDNIIVGESFPDGSCLPNKTCLIHDLSRGRCFVEKSAYFNTEKIRYGCLEVYMSDFSVEGLCNVTSEELRIHCCTDGDHCNKDVVFVDPVTDPVTATTRPTRPVTSPLLDRDSTPTGTEDETNWTVGTVVTALVFVMILLITVTVFSVSFILLRRRSILLHSQQLHHNI